MIWGIHRIQTQKVATISIFMGVCLLTGQEVPSHWSQVPYGGVPQVRMGYPRRDRGTPPPLPNRIGVLPLPPTLTHPFSDSRASAATTRAANASCGHAGGLSFDYNCLQRCWRTLWSKTSFYNEGSNACKWTSISAFYIESSTH